MLDSLAGLNFIAMSFRVWLDMRPIRGFEKHVLCSLNILPEGRCLISLLIHHICYFYNLVKARRTSVASDILCIPKRSHTRVTHFEDCLLSGELEKHGYKPHHLFAVFLYVSSMADFAHINSVYSRYFTLNPPVR